MRSSHFTPHFHVPTSCLCWSRNAHKCNIVIYTAHHMLHCTTTITHKSVQSKLTNPRGLVLVNLYHRIGRFELWHRHRTKTKDEPRVDNANVCNEGGDNLSKRFSTFRFDVCLVGGVACGTILDGYDPVRTRLYYFWWRCGLIAHEAWFVLSVREKVKISRYIYVHCRLQWYWIETKNRASSIVNYI